jgi:hypothetical protein
MAEQPSVEFIPCLGFVDVVATHAAMAEKLVTEAIHSEKVTAFLKEQNIEFDWSCFTDVTSDDHSLDREENHFTVRPSGGCVFVYGFEDADSAKEKLETVLTSEEFRSLFLTKPLIESEFGFELIEKE